MVISKRLFCLILIGLTSLAVASLCTILQLPMHQAVMLFLGTWMVMITLFEVTSLFQPHSTNLREAPRHE